MKIGIIVGSIRDGARKGEAVGKWVAEKAAAHAHVELELLDLRDFGLPLLTSPTLPMQAGKQYDSDQVTAWSSAVDACDGFVFVTPEHNHGIPGAFKNAVDSLGPEWVGKTVGFVSYGVDGGVRCVEHWRPIVANFQMLDVRQQVVFTVFSDFDVQGGFAPLDRREGELKLLLDQLTTLTSKISR